MKTSIKILLLMLAIAGAVFGVLYWQKTQVEPPKNVTFENNNLATLKASIEAVKEDLADDALDQGFDKAYDELNFLYRENLISSEERDSELKSLAERYGGLFAERSVSKLGNSWQGSEIKRMGEQSKLLSSLMTTDGNKVIEDASITDKLSTITRVQTDYGKASSLASQTGFGSVSSARNRINESKTYLNDTYLRNCSDLRNRLQKLPSRIGASHYATVKGAVNAFVSRPQAYSDIYQKKSELQSRISEYSNMTGTYGENKGVQGLRDKVNSVSDYNY